MWTFSFIKHIDLLFYLIELIYWCIKKDYFVFPFFSKIYFKCKIKWGHGQTIQCVSFRSSWGCSYSSTGKPLYLHRSIPLFFFFWTENENWILLLDKNNYHLFLILSDIILLSFFLFFLYPTSFVFSRSSVSYPVRLRFERSARGTCLIFRFLLNHFPFKRLPYVGYIDIFTVAVLAQLLEHLTAEREVAGLIRRARPILNLKIMKKCGYCLCPASSCTTVARMTM